MLPSEHFNNCVNNILVRIFRIFGVNFMMPNFKVTWPTCVTVFVMTSGICSQMYTLLAKDLQSVLKCTTTLAVAWQGIVKIFVIVRRSNTLCSKVMYVADVYRQCDGHPREAAKLIAWHRSIDILMRSFICVIAANVACFISTPLCLYLYDGRMELPLPLFLPIDEHQMNGFIIHIMFQLAALMTTALGTVGADLLILLLFIATCTLAEIVMLKLRILAEGITSTVNRPETTAYLHNIVRLQMEFLHLLQSLSDLFYMVFMMEMGLDAISMCLILFVMQQVTWIPLYLFWLMFFVKTLAACLLGAMTSIYCDRLYGAFEAFPWYKLGLKDRLKFVMILQRMQHPTVLMCGTVKLDMELFVSVMKNTYTVAMLLNSMSE